MSALYRSTQGLYIHMYIHIFSSFIAGFRGRLRVYHIAKEFLMSSLHDQLETAHHWAFGGLLFDAKCGSRSPTHVIKKRLR